jgi:hypothetical protein
LSSVKKIQGNSKYIGRYAEEGLSSLKAEIINDNTL